MMHEATRDDMQSVAHLLRSTVLVAASNTRWVCETAVPGFKLTPTSLQLDTQVALEVVRTASWVLRACCMMVMFAGGVVLLCAGPTMLRGSALMHRMWRPAEDVVSMYEMFSDHLKLSGTYIYHLWKS